MKRIIAVLLLAIMLASLLVACGKTTECAICGKTKNCSKVEVLGEKVWVCDDCKLGLNAVDSALDNLFG